MDAIDRLEALEDIKRLKARYCRLLDARRFDEWAALFTPTLRFETPHSGGEQVGVDAFVAYARDRLGDGVSVHQCHTPEIEITGDTTATAIWAMSDIVRRQASDGREITITGAGHYRESYELTNGGWRISALRLTRLLLDTVETAGAD
jgi:SnoaL-like domain